MKEELGVNPTEEEWQTWIKKWSKLSFEDFLRSDIYQIETGNKLRPWPEAALEAYKVSA